MKHSFWRARGAFAVLFMLLSFGVSGLHAQGEDTLTATPYRTIYVFEGPGITHVMLGHLEPGAELTPIERNRVGDWLHVRYGGGEGWVMTAFLTLDPALRLSQIPVDFTAVDGDPATVDRTSLKTLYSAPVISPVYSAMEQVFARGATLGNHADVVTKVGDSVTADTMYLQPMNRTDNVLGPFDFLAESLSYFGPLMTRSIAARVGMTSYALFDPMWATDEACEDGESPLVCEYRVRQPSIAFVMFGGNDVQHMTYEEYGEQMRQIVEVSLDAGVIPVLSTFSYSEDNPLWLQSLEFNLQILIVADEYDVPLINLWAAAQALPSDGLDADGIHMMRSGFANMRLDTSFDLTSGVGVRNLLSLVMLDQLRTTLGIDRGE